MPELLKEPGTVALFPLKLREDLEVHDPTDMAVLVIAETGAQVAAKASQSREVQSEYRFSCDCLNANRMVLRLLEEGWDADQRDFIVTAMIQHICTKRGYDVEDFRAGMEATRKRARFPFGLRPLTMARERALKKPIQLKDPSLEKAKTAHLIANLAYHLQKIVGENNPIMLPVEEVRKLFGLRKLVVSGTIRLLMFAGVLECTNPLYHTGRARQFRFVGLRGVHYETEDMKNRAQEEIPF
jgi:hypothetical protein